MENKIYKPMSLEKEELTKGIASHINNSELPLFIIESILKGQSLSKYIQTTTGYLS